MKKLLLMSILLILSFTQTAIADQVNTTVNGIYYINLSFQHIGNECIMTYAGANFNCSYSSNVTNLPISVTLPFMYNTTLVQSYSNVSFLNLTTIDFNNLNFTCPSGEDLKQWIVTAMPGIISTHSSNPVLASFETKFNTLSSQKNFEQQVNELNLSKTRCEAQLESANFKANIGNDRIKEYSTLFFIIVGALVFSLAALGIHNFRFKRKMMSDQTNYTDKNG